MNFDARYAKVLVFCLTDGSEQPMDEIIQRLVESNFLDLKGTKVFASIPVPEHLINELVEAALRGNKNIDSLVISVLPQNRVAVNVKTRSFPLALNLKLKLDKSIDFASYPSPKLRGWLENNRLLGSLGSLFNILPHWVKLYGDQVVIDLGAFLQTPEQKQILALVKSVEIQTEDGKVILDVKIEVD